MTAARVSSLAVRVVALTALAAPAFAQTAQPSGGGYWDVRPAPQSWGLPPAEPPGRTPAQPVPQAPPGLPAGAPVYQGWPNPPPPPQAIPAPAIPQPADTLLREPVAPAVGGVMTGAAAGRAERPGTAPQEVMAMPQGGRAGVDYPAPVPPGRVSAGGLDEAVQCAAALQISAMAAPSWSRERGVPEASNAWLAAAFSRAERSGVRGDQVSDLVRREMDRQTEASVADPAGLSRRAFGCATRPPA